MAFTRGVEAGDMIDATSGLDIECVNGLFLLSPMRSVKSPEELALMRKASAMNDRMMEALAKYLRPGLTERHPGLRDELSRVSRRQAQGSRRCHRRNSALPHYGGDNDRTLEERDIVMVDCGGWYDDYSHDMTRMFFIGEPTEEHAGFTTSSSGPRQPRKKRLRRRHPGGTGQNRQGHHRGGRVRRAFNHRLGHGIGMDGHEAPFISQANRKPLVEGNCFSIEPGIYLRGKFGVRIENLLMLTASGTEVINLYPKELMVLRNG